MDNNKYILNTDKTGAMIIVIRPLESLDRKSSSTRILDSEIIFQNSVKYLGVRLDHTVSMSERMSDICRSLFLSLGRIRCIRAYIAI